MKLKKLDIKNLTEVKFMYDTRRNTLVDKMLRGEKPDSFEKHHNYLKENYEMYYIAYQDNTPMGYSQICDRLNKICEVGFVIHPEFQGKGYGKELVLETISEAQKNYGLITLMVLNKNAKAAHIYFKLNFEVYYKTEDKTYMILKD